MIRVTWLLEKPSKFAKLANPASPASFGFPNGSSGDPSFGCGGIGGAGAPLDDPESGLGIIGGGSSPPDPK
jgi:hypothetical protein